MLEALLRLFWLIAMFLNKEINVGVSVSSIDRSSKNSQLSTLHFTVNRNPQYSPFIMFMCRMNEKPVYCHCTDHLCKYNFEIIKTCKLTSPEERTQNVPTHHYLRFSTIVVFKSNFYSIIRRLDRNRSSVSIQNDRYNMNMISFLYLNSLTFKRKLRLISNLI